MLAILRKFTILNIYCEKLKRQNFFSEIEKGFSQTAVFADFI